MANFSNVRSVSDTLALMVQSVIQPNALGAHKTSCYGHVCQTIRKHGEDLQPTDSIVFLGMDDVEGVNRAILVRDKEVLMDTLRVHSPEFKGERYTMFSTNGVAGIDMCVKAKIPFSEFVQHCIDYIKRPAVSNKLALE